MKYCKKVLGERVYLSPYNADDIELVVKWLNDPAIADGLGDTFVMHNTVTQTQWLENTQKNGDYAFAIVKNGNNELIGSIGLFDLKLACGSATVGIFIGEAENRGKGYGAEAMKLLLGYAFGVLNLYNIMLSVYEFNESAIKSYKKVGFKEIGRRRKAYYLNNKRHDIIHMDITKDDFYRSKK